MTLWTVQEYCSANNTWGVRVVQLKAPPPATPSSATPSTAAAGTTSVNVTVTGSVAAGSGFYDPGSDFPKRIAATVNGGGVSINSITYTSPTSITLNLNVASNAAPGARTITVTNPDGQSVSSATGILTILPPTPVVTLKVNGQHPMPPTVTTTGPMLLTLDVSASAYTAPLSWYWGLIINDQPTLRAGALDVHAVDRRQHDRRRSAQDRGFLILALLLVARQRRARLRGCL